MDSQFVETCQAELAAIPRENWKFVGDRVRKKMQARVKEVQGAIKDAENERREVSLQILVEGDSLLPEEVKHLQKKHGELTSRVEELVAELGRIEERRSHYRQFTVRPEDYAPFTISR